MNLKKFGIVLPHRRLFSAHPWSDLGRARPLHDIEMLLTEAEQQGLVCRKRFCIRATHFCKARTWTAIEHAHMRLFMSHRSVRLFGCNQNNDDYAGRRMTCSWGSRANYHTIKTVLVGDDLPEPICPSNFPDGLVVLFQPGRRGVALRI